MVNWSRKTSSTVAFCLLSTTFSVKSELFPTLNLLQTLLFIVRKSNRMQSLQVAEKVLWFSPSKEHVILIFFYLGRDFFFSSF